MTDDTLLTVKEAADMLRVSKMTIYRLIKDEKNPLGAVKVRGTYRVSKQRMNAYLRNSV